jgi:1-deoxy-D-xylulose-5-phosphate reductoisomerase
VGTQALSVCRTHADKIDVVALSVHSDVAFLAAAVKEFSCAYAAVTDPAHATDALLGTIKEQATVITGASALSELCELPEVDCVLVAVVGEVGIASAYATLKAGKRLALANKEALVAGGDLLMPMAAPGQIIPVDSEHSAIFQCLVGEAHATIDRLWLTCSGGPFRGRTREELAYVTAAEALAHPTWKMGPKITIDSATLMNKGLEVIEAHHLFNLPVDNIEVLIHPQSKIHSMVEFSDASTKAQVGPSDMRIPIQYAFSYPNRWQPPCERIDYHAMAPLTFDAPDLATFRCLDLALVAGREGGTLPCVLNAANEVANAAFRAGYIGFCDIDQVCERVMDQACVETVASLEHLCSVDAHARKAAREIVKRMQDDNSSSSTFCHSLGPSAFVGTGVHS